jgi:Lar family restriction alleviation protein
MLPCPTCGENKQIISHTNYPGERRVICNYLNGGCGTATAAGDSDDEAITKWNRRPGDPA